MAKIKMVRIDYRLIHGQIVAKWIKFRPVDRLILVDDDLVEDEFMGDIYRMAVPQKEVDIVRLNEISETINKVDDKVMLIFKDVQSAYKVFKDGFLFPEINVGAIQDNKDRKSVIQGVSLSKEEFGMLKEIQNQGVNVFLQPIPENDATKLSSIEKKFL